MKNKEDSSESILTKVGMDFAEFSLPITAQSLENELHTSIEHWPGSLHKSEPSQFLPTPENKSQGTLSGDSSSKLENRRDDELRIRLENAIIQHARDREEIDRLNTQIEIDTAFCLNLGAVLGILMWRASNEPDVINRWLSEKSCRNKGGEFVSIADRIISTFFKTYKEVLPPSSTDEYQFAMGLLGTITNISARPEGRQFLIEKKNGKNLVENLVKYFPKIPTDSGSKLKSLVLSILWNMSVNKTGLDYLYELKIGRLVDHCLDEANADKLGQVGLQLLQSIIYNVTDRRYLHELLGQLSIENLRRIAEEDRREKHGSLAKELLKYLTNEKNFTSRSNERLRNE